PYLNKRLKLNSVDIIDIDTSEPIQTYKFEYDMTQLPQKLSYAKDYWGGYNGEDENDGLTPELIATSIFDYNNYSTFKKNNMRAVNRNTVAAANLTKIIYPTKGYSIFSYEPNTVTYFDYLPDYNNDNIFLSWKNIKNPYIKSEYLFDTKYQDLGIGDCSCNGCCTREILNDMEAIYLYKFNTQKPLQSKFNVKSFNIDCLEYSQPNPDDPV